MAQSTREKLVRAAYELFMSNGINAVGLDQIIKRVGVTKSTFYNHFESKDDLVLAVLKWRDSLWPTELRAALLRKAGPRPRDQLLALFEMLDEAWGTKGYTGCVFIYASSEFPHQHDPIHLVAKAHVRTVWSAILELAAYAGARDPKELARELVLLAAGTYAISQMGEPRKAAQTGRRMANRLINSHLTKSRQRR
jgi:AcrR family transcriptional regulator